MTFPPAFTGIPPDLVSGTVSIADGVISFRILFAPGTFDSKTQVALHLDTDLNPATGDTFWAGGGDFIIRLHREFGISAEYRRYGPTGNSVGSFVDPPQPLVLENGYLLSVPLSVLDNDDGLMTVRVGAARSLALQFGPGTFTSPLDWMPDIAGPPASVQ